MKSVILTILLLFAITFKCISLTVHFEYDASSNRTHRWVNTIEMKDPAADTTFKLGKEFWPTENLLVLSEVKVFPNPVAFDDT